MTSLLVSLGYPILVEDYIDSSAFRWSSFPPNNAGPHLPIPPFSFSSRHCYISPSDPPTNIMVGQGKRPYAVDKLYQNNLDQNVNGRKQVPGADYTIRTIPKRLQDGFSSKLASKKKSAPVPPAPHATRSATAAADAERIASSKKSPYDGKTPFTPGKRRGRKKNPKQKDPPPPSVCIGYSPINTCKCRNE